MNTYPTPSPVALRIRFAGGSLLVQADTRDTTTIEVAPGNPSSSSDVEYAEATVVERRGGEIVVTAPDVKRWFGRTPKLDVRVAVPVDSATTVAVESADVRLTGQLGDTEVTSASGLVRVDQAASFTVTTASGDVWGDVATGDARVKSASGDVRLDEVGGTGDVTTASGDIILTTIGRDARVRTASGNVTIGTVHGSASGRTASGDIRIGSIRRGTVEIDSASGDVWVGVASGTAAWLEVQSLSGKVGSDLAATESPDDGADTVTIRARTLSGDIAIRRAPAD